MSTDIDTNLHWYIIEGETQEGNRFRYEVQGEDFLDACTKCPIPGDHTFHFCKRIRKGESHD